MPRSFQYSMVVALLLPGVGKGQECLPADHTLEASYVYAVKLATSEDPVKIRDRDAYGVLPVPESEIEIVEDTIRCRRAAEAYHQALEGTGSAPDVHVIRIGRRYLVFEPATTAESEFFIFIIFDEEFTRVGSFVG